MVNGFNYNRSFFVRIIANIRQIVQDLAKTLVKLVRFRKKSTPPAIYIFDSSLLNMQTGPIEVKRGGIEKDGIDYSYVYSIGMSIRDPKDMVRIRDIH